LPLNLRTFPKNLPGSRLKNEKIALLVDVTIMCPCLLTYVSVTGGRLEILPLRRAYLFDRRWNGRKVMDWGVWRGPDRKREKERKKAECIESIT